MVRPQFLESLTTTDIEDKAYSPPKQARYIALVTFLIKCPNLNHPRYLSAVTCQAENSVLEIEH